MQQQDCMNVFCSILINQKTPLMRTLTNIVTRVLAIVVITMLVAGDAALTYAQDAAVRTYSMVATQTNNMDIPGQGAQSFDVTFETVLDVSKTGDEMYHIIITNISLEGSPAGDGGITSLIGVEMDVTLNADGSIDSVTGLEDNAAIIEMGGVHVFQERLQSLFLHGPGGELSIGKSWSHSTELPRNQSGMELETVTDTSYEVVGEESRDGVDVWVITVKGDVMTTGSGSAQGQNMDMQMEGETEGKIYVDKTTGAVVASESTGEMEGTIDMDAFSILMTITLANNVSSSTI